MSTKSFSDSEETALSLVPTAFLLILYVKKVSQNDSF
uniref:PSII M protein n=1 Tax=Cyrtosia septentrionalis TaxID=112170 RepID=A0A481YLR6_9ASPA|nr:PSII M protein [Cyrtosia septentrionalis]